MYRRGRSRAGRRCPAHKTRRGFVVNSSSGYLHTLPPHGIQSWILGSVEVMVLGVKTASRKGVMISFLPKTQIRLLECVPRAVWLNLQGRNSAVDTRLCTYGLAAKADNPLHLAPPFSSVTSLPQLWPFPTHHSDPSSNLHFLSPSTPSTTGLSSPRAFHSISSNLTRNTPDNNINPIHHVLPSLVRSAQRSGVPCQYH